MGQNNANVNQFIARATRKDSTAMKTIAVLGMIFLPGTFLAVGPYPFSLFSYSKYMITDSLVDRHYSPCPS